jgi:hypothetical protein
VLIVHDKLFGRRSGGIRSCVMAALNGSELILQGHSVFDTELILPGTS